MSFEIWESLTFTEQKRFGRTSTCTAMGCKPPGHLMSVAQAWRCHCAQLLETVPGKIQIHRSTIIRAILSFNRNLCDQESCVTRTTCLTDEKIGPLEKWSKGVETLLHDQIRSKKSNVMQGKSSALSQLYDTLILPPSLSVLA